MAGENFTLTTFYAEWKNYQERMKASLAPLTAGQLALRAAPGLRSVGENAAHIVGCRAGWYTYTLGEDASAYGTVSAEWNAQGHTAAELVQGLDDTWRFMSDCLARWSDDDMRKLFDDDWDGEIVHLSRAWIVWHVMEHDLHHGGEISHTLGMHDIPAQFPG